MGTKYLSAWTSLEGGLQGPPYVNFSDDEDVGTVVIRGREKAKPGEQYGRDFAIEIPKLEFEGLMQEIARARGKS